MATWLPRFARAPSDRETAPPALRFEPDWYLAAYPEAAAAVAAGRRRDAAAHFEAEGAATGCDPNPLFAERWYRERHPDVAAAVQAGVYPTGFAHFVAAGHREGRAPSPLWVDEGWYLDRYPDVAPMVERGALRSATEHYLTVGAEQGRDPHPAFAERWYRERYPDVAELVATGRWLSGYRHFLDVGIAEGRRPHPEYDETLYRLWNADVDAAIERGEWGAGYLHLVPQGLAEGRRWRTPATTPTVRRAATALATVRLDELLASSRRLSFPTVEQPDVSVVVVLWNRAELTLACLESLLAVREPSLELVLVDNASTDRTGELLARLDGVRLLRHDENLGFTRAVVAGAALARGRHLLLLNSDAEVLPETIAAAAARLDGDPRIGAVGGRVIALDGTLEEAGSIVWRDGTTEGYGRGDDPRAGAYLFSRTVDYVSGVFLLTPRRLFEELGGLDLRFTPAYYEEADYCFRLRRADYEVVYEPAAVVRHFGSASLPSESRLHDLLSRHRRLFVEAHRDVLAAAPEPAPERRFAASSREPVVGRVLWLDDDVPLERLGAGFPRLRAAVLALRELGWAVTCFATHPRDVDEGAVRRELASRGVEVISHLGRERFAEFWTDRRTSYDLVVVSRQHNLRKLLESGPDLREGRPDLRLVFDCEALVAERLAARRAAIGEASSAETELSLDEELDLAARADAVWTVSPREAEVLRTRCARVHVVGHAVDPRPGTRPFAERTGLLFVGRLVEPWSPNVDGLTWFLDEVLPRLRDTLGEEVPLTVAGPRGDVALPAPAGVVFTGPVDDLAPLYDAHRLFVAPARFGAGIPLKLLDAAAHGLPAVASPLLVRQLGWAAEIASGGHEPATFAAAVADLYRDEERWQALREAATRRVTADYGPDPFRRALTAALAALGLPSEARSRTPGLALGPRASRPLPSGSEARPGTAGVPPAPLPAPEPQTRWHSRGYLPHFDESHRVQSITFRLHDSVPRDVIESWQAELGWSTDIAVDEAAVRSLRRRIDRYEDAGRGECWLQRADLAEIVEGALLHFDGTRYQLLAWCVMPNHVHVVCEQVEGHPLAEIVQSWKSHTAKRANRILERSGAFWMADYHDRFVRDELHLNRVLAYVEGNPVKAGLVASAEEWRWGSAARRRMRVAKE